jgi:mono/diheme cytochrome c family protein
MKPLPPLALALAAVAIIVVVAPARAEDADRGKELALRWCVACHVVEGETPGGDAGPPFASLVNTLGRSEDDLRGWLSDPHPPMPDLNLSSIEIDDIIAYIATLRN